MCCQTCALQVVYFKSKSENDMGTKWDKIINSVTSTAL